MTYQERDGPAKDFDVLEDQDRWVVCPRCGGTGLTAKAKGSQIEKERWEECHS